MTIALVILGIVAALVALPFVIPWLMKLLFGNNKNPF